MMKGLGITVVAALFLSGCWEEQSSGPEDIKYDREVCTYCKMIISDPRFAAEIRQAKGKPIRKFDDIGDAMHWLKLVPWKETPQTEIWVRDMATGKTWLDARKSFYISGRHSPMEYGFGAVAEKTEGAVSFEVMRKTVLARGSTSRCEQPNHSSAVDKHVNMSVVGKPDRQGQPSSVWSRPAQLPPARSMSIKPREAN